MRANIFKDFEKFKQHPTQKNFDKFQNKWKRYIGLWCEITDNVIKEKLIEAENSILASHERGG